MIYLHRYTTDADGRMTVEIAACEDIKRATAYDARGFSRCSLTAFRAAWRLRDAIELRAMRADAGLELARAVGETAPAQVAGLPSGMALHIIKH